jgi:hypothetical protein
MYKDGEMQSNKNPISGKAFTEFPGRTALFLFKNSVEI